MNRGGVRRGVRLALALVLCFAAAALAPLVAARPAGGSPPSWTVTALGDSVTAGTACGCIPFVQRYATLTAAATGARVGTRNLGVPGQTAEALVTSLTSDAAVVHQVAASDIVLVTIGANDLVGDLDAWSDGGCPLSCFQDAMPGVTADLSAIVRRIQTLRGARATQILVTDYWNVFRDGDVATALGADYSALSDQVTRLANKAICTGAEAAGAECVDLYGPFKGDGSTDPTPLLAADGDHPDAAGHDLIARTLADAGWRSLLRR